MTNQNGKFIFTSDRLGYRLLNENDLGDYLKLDSNPEVRKYFPTGVLDGDKVKENIYKNIEFFKSNGFGVFIAIELKSGEFVGRCGFGKIPTGEIEVGYVFLSKFWGNGLVSEGLIAMLKWANEHIHSVESIIAYTPEDHIASQRVMQKAGMKFSKKEFKDGEELIYYKIDLRK